VGLGEAIDAVRELGVPRIEKHDLTLAAIAHSEMMKMALLRVVSPPPGPSATALVAAIVDAAIDAGELRAAMQERHGVVIQLAEKRWFNGIRVSPHIFNNEAQMTTALAALRTELRKFKG